MIRGYVRDYARRVVRGSVGNRAGSSASTNDVPVIVLLGQSLAAPRGTAAATGTIANGRMLVGGAHMQGWLFYSSSAEQSVHYDDVSSAVVFQDTNARSSGQSPLYGVVSEVLNGGAVARVYVGGVANPGTQIASLTASTYIANLAAMCTRLCDLARADGYTPKVYFYSAHGESDAFAGTSRATYLSVAGDYYRRVQLYASWAMEDPAWVAPVLLTYMSQRANPANVGTNERNICLAIRDICDQVAGCVDIGGITQWPVSTDGTHPTVAAYIQRGEWVGYWVRRHLLNGATHSALRVTSCTLSGTTFVATFSHNIVRDASTNVGSGLNTANQEDGLEWWDNGANIAIVAGSLVYGANTVTGTLASAPVGSLAQQELRVAMMGAPASTTYPSGVPGSNIRRDESGFASQYVPGFQHYTWASPQVFASVT